MVNDAIRNAIQNYCRELELDEAEMPRLFDNESYDYSIIGLTDDNRVVYSYESMIIELMKTNNWTEEEAIEWIEYNTLRALPYDQGVGKKPIIVSTTVDELVEKYNYKED